MAKKRTWSGVAVSMQSAIATAKTITAITKASTAVVTSTAHGYVNGDYVLLEVQGMNEVNNIVARCANITANTFELERINSTDYATFSSGTAKLLTLGTSISTFTDVNSSGGEASDIDFTTIHDVIDITVPGRVSAIKYGFSSIWDVDDPGFIKMNEASKTKSERAFLFSWPDGARMAFYGRVQASGIPGGSSQDKVTTQVDISATGQPTYFST